MTLKHRKMKFKPSIKLNHNIYSYSRIVAPFPILFPRGRGGCTQSISCASYSVSCNPVLTPYLSWGDFNFIWTSQCQRAHVTLYLCFWCNISNMRCSVSSPDETPRRELKIRRAAEYFWRTSRCFIWWWNTVSNVWYFFSNKIIFEGEIKDANTKQCFIRFSNTHWTLISFVFS